MIISHSLHLGKCVLKLRVPIMIWLHFGHKWFTFLRGTPFPLDRRMRLASDALIFIILHFLRKLLTTAERIGLSYELSDLGIPVDIDSPSTGPSILWPFSFNRTFLSLTGFWTQLESSTSFFHSVVDIFHLNTSIHTLHNVSIGAD